jgi:hypothetical protein
LLGEHWMMLLWTLTLYQYVYPAHSEYVPRAVWDELLGRLREELDHPNPRAVFRGSLIDDRMFAIDANEWGMANLYEQFRGARLDGAKFDGARLDSGRQDQDRGDG